jgi:hypothetical protein
MQRDEEAALGVERPLELVRSEADRPETAGATLDAFAEPPQEATAEPARAEKQPGDSWDAELQIAYQGGHDAKHRGEKKSAVPSQYREKPDLALAWQHGFDGKPLPE